VTSVPAPVLRLSHRRCRARRRAGRRVPWPALLWLAVFFAIGVYAARGVAWWPIGALPVVAPLLAASRAYATSQTIERPRRPNLAIAGAIVLAAVALLPVWRQ